MSLAHNPMLDMQDAEYMRERRFAAAIRGFLSFRASYWNRLSGVGVAMQAPRSYNSFYPYVEFNYASSANILGASNTPRVATGSYLKVYKGKLSGHPMFDFIPNLEWMSLTARALSIGDARTLWPGTVSSPIANDRNGRRTRIFE